MKVSGQTIARTAVLIIALANQLLTAFGANPFPFSDNEVYEAVSIIVSAAASVWAWWKNNSFTAEALKADDFLKKLKGDKNES